MARKIKIIRKTKETDIHLEIDLDKTTGSRIATTIPFLDHMFELFAKHGFLKLVVKSKGDTQIDDHHLVEDLGICLGQAIAKALGKNRHQPLRFGMRSDGRMLMPRGSGYFRTSLSDLQCKIRAQKNRRIRSRVG